MIIRGHPKNIDNYIKVDTELSLILHENGFFPKYISGDFIYYFKEDALIKFIDGRNQE